jgi:hypothetical protein
VKVARVHSKKAYKGWDGYGRRFALSGISGRLELNEWRFGFGFLRRVHGPVFHAFGAAFALETNTVSVRRINGG